MSKWITVRLIDGTKMSLNVKRILSVAELAYGDQALIMLNEGTKIFVEESYDEVMKKIYDTESGIYL